MSPQSKHESVLIYYLFPDMVSGHFCQSLVQLVAHDFMGDRRIAGVFSVKSGALLATARNGVAEQFLETPADWLMFIDSDMVFEPDAVDRLLQTADPETHPILGGLCYGLDQVDGPFPVVYRLVDTPDGPMTYRPNILERDTGILQVDATGSAFILIHRSVLEAVRDRGFSKAYPWFQETELGGGHPVGEDITFCLRARTLGFPIHVDLDTRIGHHKSQIVIGKAPIADPVAEPVVKAVG